MKNKTLLAIFIICFVAALILATVPPEQACGLPGEEENGCTIVSKSEYAKTIGINNSYLGLVAFTILILLTISHMRKPKRHKLLFKKTIIIPMGIGALYFIYLQAFVIQAFCKYCMVIDIGILLSIIIIFYDEKWHNKLKKIFSKKKSQQ